MKHYDRLGDFKASQRDRYKESGAIDLFKQIVQDVMASKHSTNFISLTPSQNSPDDARDEREHEDAQSPASTPTPKIQSDSTLAPGKTFQTGASMLKHGEMLEEVKEFLVNSLRTFFT